MGSAADKATKRRALAALVRRDDAQIFGCEGDCIGIRLVTAGAELAAERFCGNETDSSFKSHAPRAPPLMQSTVDAQRAIGAVPGSAIGDALGAPFEFGPAGQFTTRFPTSALGPSTEMVGGENFGWAPGEFTDDTQMALIIAESLLAHDGFDGADIFNRFRVWAQSAGDVGAQTQVVLSAGDWQKSATEHFTKTGHAAGNGSLMRATTSAVYAASGTLESVDRTGPCPIDLDPR